MVAAIESRNQWSALSRVVYCSSSRWYRLRRFPFDKIKIDRSFMQGIDTSGRDAETVVRAIIALGRELDMRVTVEGVETAKQVAFLDSANADRLQGYFFGKPMPASEIGALILKNFRARHFWFYRRTPKGGPRANKQPSEG